MQSHSVPPSATLNHDISVHLLGEETVLFDKRQQKLYSASSSATVIWSRPGQAADALRERFGLDRSMAGQYADAVIRQWRPGPRQDHPGSANFGSTDAASAHPQAPSRVPLGRPAMERHYRILDSTIALRSSTLCLGSGVDRLLRHLRTPGTEAPDIVLDLAPLEGGYGLMEAGDAVGTCAAIEQAAALAKAVMVQRALRRSGDFCAIHAGAVRRVGSDRCVLLPGSRGNGTSTLVAGLASEGFEVLADETAVLADAGLLVRPLACGISVEPEAWDVLSIRYPRLRRAPVHDQPDGGQVRYLLPPEYPVAAPGVRAPAGWIVFPKWDRRAATELYPISKRAALQRLMPCFLPLQGGLESADVERLVRWISEVRSYALRTSSLNEAVALVAKLCQ